MYEYLTGLVTYISPFYLVLEVNGIGYRLQVANPYRYEENQATTIFVYQAFRENDVTLFGFFDRDEKILFEKLISVSGIGPKSALAILANDDHAGLIQAIQDDNVKFLTQFPGVGKKTAQQIILDLKGKLSDLQIAGETIGQQSLLKNSTSNELADSIAALSALGYSQKEIKAITPQLEDYPASSTDDYLREGLRLLTQHK